MINLIAEFCQNHNGNFDVLKRMIWEAAEGGATYGKIQSIFADDLSYREKFEKGVKDADGNVLVIERPYRPEYERLKGLELSYDQHEQFIKECEKAGLIPLTTAFNITSIPALRNFGWRSIKVASYDCGSLSLIRQLCHHFDELIISTGATFDSEIEATARYLCDIGKPFTLLHCVTVYPTPLEMMNLKRLKYLQQFTPSVGLSDHSLVARDGVKAAIAAIYLGATTIERHFTILPEDQTRDGRVSIRKEHLGELVTFSRMPKDEQREYCGLRVPEYQDMLGIPVRELSGDELLNRAYYRGRFCNKIGDRELFNWDKFDWDAYLNG